MAQSSPRFAIGQLVYHRSAHYRGVVVQADESFQLDPEWYQTLARARAAGDGPWYRVLVHEADHETYVAERHLLPDASGKPIEHPHLGLFFDVFENGCYKRRRLLN